MTNLKPGNDAGRKPPGDPDVRRMLEWLGTLIPADEWGARVDAARRRFYESFMPRERSPQPQPLRHFDEDDIVSWYLYLAESAVDYMGDYEPNAGSRVIPVFKSLGRDLDLLLTVDGAEERARRLLTAERRQPDAGLFELLVALAYRREGSRARFVPELPGRARTPDLECEKEGITWSVECKRLAASDYAWRERKRFWELWRPASSLVATDGLSVFVDVTFTAELFHVPDTYLYDHLVGFLFTGSRQEWSDAYGQGSVSWLDLRPLKRVLQRDFVMQNSQRLFELLAGEYRRYASYAGLGRFKSWDRNPRYLDKVDFYSLARWHCVAEGSIDAQARHVLRQVADANNQLPGDRPGAIHVGLEALAGEYVELVRYPKMVEKLGAFEPNGSGLAWIYCHYFVPEAPPDEAWAFDETTLWFDVSRGRMPEPLPRHFVVIPEQVNAERRPHWVPSES